MTVHVYTIFSFLSEFHQLRHLEFKKEKKKEHYQNIQEAEYQIHYYNNVCCPL